MAICFLILRSDIVLVDRNAATLHRIAGACGLALAGTLMFVSVERWGKWFVGALGCWTIKAIFTLVFHPNGMLLQYLVLFIFAFVLCARFALIQAPRPPVEKFGMITIVIALSFSLTLDAPRWLLVGIVASALTQLVSHIFRTPHKRARLPEAS